MVMIRKIAPLDALSICNIYNYYILNTAISFETEAVSEDEILRRIDEITTNCFPYYVYEVEGKVLGYCYLSPWKGRCAYRTTAEISIYIDKDYTHQGIGIQLMKQLLDNVDNNRFHTIIAGIALPNQGSVALHEKFGFTKISHFHEIGYKFGEWQDVGHWQLILKK